MKQYKTPLLVTILSAMFIFSIIMFKVSKVKFKDISFVFKYTIVLNNTILNFYYLIL